MTLTLSALIHSDLMGMDVPSAIQTPSGMIYFWSEAGCYMSAAGVELYLEPDDADGTLSADSFYEEA